jgi:uncharacterized protein (TIGR02246 family)
MKIIQTYPAALIAIHTIDSERQKAKLAIRGLIQHLGLAFLAFTLVIGTTGCASVSAAQDERSVRALGDTFANAFVQKNAELRASLFAEDGTFVTPQGDFLQGRAAMAKDFGPEAQQAVNGSTEAAFSNYRIRFVKPDVAVVDALLTVRNVNGPDGTIIPVIPIDFFYVAVRHGDKWLIQDGRAHFAAAPPSNMTKSGASRSTQTVKNIVLVHGAFADGSSWSKVIPLLQAKGFEAKAGAAAWRNKPAWYVVASNDLMISPEQEESMAKQIKAKTIILPASHAVMLSHPKEVAKVIEEAAGGRQN